MDQQFSRRAVLATIAGTAGCLGQQRDGGASTTPRTETPDETGTDAPMRTATATATTTGTTTETTTTEPTTTREPVAVREWPDEYYQGPLVSAHEHMNGSDGFVMTHERMDWFVRWMDRNRVAQVMAISGDRYMDVIEAHDDRLIPFAFAWSETRNLDTAAESFEERLTKYPAYDGLGEIGLKQGSSPDGPGPIPADHPEMLEVYDLAAEHDVPVMVHTESPWRYPEEQRERWDGPADFVALDQLANAYEHNRDTDFLVHQSYQWDGATDDELIADALDKHPNLYFDLSPTAPYAYGHGLLSRDEFESKMAETGIEHHAQLYYEEHAAILEDYSDRLLWGMDAAKSWHYTDWALNTWLDIGRSLLGRIPEEDARNVGYRTAEELFDIEVEMRVDA